MKRSASPKRGSPAKRHASHRGETSSKPGAPASVCRDLVHKVFSGLKTNQREEIAEEVNKRYIVLRESEASFAKKAKESAERQRALEIAKPLGSRGWRTHKQLDDFGSMNVSANLIESFNQLWLEYVRPILNAHPRGLPFEVVQSMDWHGASVRVMKARNPRSVGIEGIVFAVNELQLWVIDRNQKKWWVDKDGTDFEMIFDDQKLKIDGSLYFEKDIKVGKTRQRKETRNANRMKKKQLQEETEKSANQSNH